MTLFVVELFTKKSPENAHGVKNGRHTRSKNPLQKTRGELPKKLTLVEAHASSFLSKPWLWGLWFCRAEKVARRSPID